jgi:hypothetical protein
MEQTFFDYFAQEYLSHHGVQPLHIPIFGLPDPRFALIRACRTNNVSLFLCALERGAVINKRCAELAAKHGSVDVLKLILDIKPYSVQRLLRYAIRGKLRSTFEDIMEIIGTMEQINVVGEPSAASNFPATCEMLILLGATNWRKLHLNKTQVIRLWNSGKVPLILFAQNSPRYTQGCTNKEQWQAWGCMRVPRYVKWIRQYTTWKKHAEMQLLRCDRFAQDIVKRVIMSFV